MTKVRPKKPEDTAVFKFNNNRERKYFTLMMLDVIIIFSIGYVVPGRVLPLVLCGSIVYLLMTHLKGYHLANKEVGDKA